MGDLWMWLISIAAAFGLGWFLRRGLHTCSLTIHKKGHRVTLSEYGTVLDEPKWSNEEKIIPARSGDHIQFIDQKGAFLNITIED